jgi:NAD(P)-dependent dehydrogenase (short-subunit alcohol dehydrogenase family)
MELRGKAALVTGGAVRLGRAIALGLARRGADVLITYHSSSREAEAAVEEMRSLGVRAAAARCDQRREAEVRAAVQAELAAFGRLDVLVNSAAIFPRRPLAELDAAAWDEALETNLRGPFLFALHAAPALKADGGGKIINLADVAGVRPWPNYLPYSVSKAGVIALTHGLAKALAPEVQVNAVAPGAILWPGDYPEEQRRAVLARVPLARAGSPADVVNTILYLIEASDYVTGALIPVDGGRLID